MAVIKEDYMMEVIVKIIATFVISLSFGIILDVPKKFLLHISLISAMGRIAYIISTEFNNSIVISTFIATVIITIFSHILARVFKAPVTVFLITGILPLVPGRRLYLLVYNFLKEDTELALDAALNTFMIAGAIALAIFFVDSVFKVIKTKNIFKL